MSLNEKRDLAEQRRGVFEETQDTFWGAQQKILEEFEASLAKLNSELRNIRVKATVRRRYHD